MAEQAKIVTGIGQAELHRILVRGYDLNKDLVGKITFTDMTSLILRGRLPTANEAKMLDALMIILVEHVDLAAQGRAAGCRAGRDADQHGLFSTERPEEHRPSQFGQAFRRLHERTHLAPASGAERDVLSSHSG